MSRRQQRLYRREKTRLILRWLIAGSLTILVICLAINFCERALNSLARYNREVVSPQTGCLEETCQGDAIVMHDEETYYAPSEGYFENAVREGERVRVGSTAGFYSTVNGKRIKVEVPATGIYTKHTDGLENAFKHVPLEDLVPEAFAYKPSETVKSGHYYQGDAVFKIVDNIKPTEVLVRVQGLLPEQAGKDHEVVLRCGSRELGKALINRIIQLGPEHFLLLQCREFHQSLTKDRFLNLTIIFDRQEGTIIPQKALRSKGSETGIYCIEGERIYFRSVTVLKRQKDMVVVEGLQPNELIIVNSKK